MSEKRGQIRTAFKAQIRVEHPKMGEFHVVTRDMSNSGLFLLSDEVFEINIGDEISVQSLDIEDAPIIFAKVVRMEKNGIAVMYLDE